MLRMYSWSPSSSFASWNGWIGGSWGGAVFSWVDVRPLLQQRSREVAPTEHVATFAGPGGCQECAPFGRRSKNVHDGVYEQVHTYGTRKIRFNEYSERFKLTQNSGLCSCSQQSVRTSGTRTQHRTSALPVEYERATIGCQTSRLALRGGPSGFDDLTHNLFFSYSLNAMEHVAISLPHFAATVHTMFAQNLSSEQPPFSRDAGATCPCTMFWV